MNKLFHTNKAFRFRQFTRKAYAAFCSLHREVTIGTLRLYVTDREMLKAGRAVALALLLFTSAPASADEDNPLSAADTSPAATIHRQLSLQEVQVVARQAEVNSRTYRLVTAVSHEEIQSLPIQTVADVLRYLPGIDVRTRGANGSQADISMRGGTFDQVLIMLNGVNLTDAQTGHYSLNLPLSVDLIERIEVLQGTASNLFGLNAFSGAINIITKPILTSLNSPQGASEPFSTAGFACSTTLRLTAGMNSLVNPAATLRLTSKPLLTSLNHSEPLSTPLNISNSSSWYLNASAEYNRSDGYYAPNPSDKEQTAITNSDYRICNLYVQTGWRDLDIQLGAQYKDAGAGMFYGFGSQDQFDATRTAFGAARYRHQWGVWGLEATASYRANYDRYEWHRGQRLYGNFHFTQITAASLKASYASRIGKTTAGLELRNENIHSTNLGDTVNPNGQVPNVPGFPLSDVRVLELVKGANRLNINYFAEQSFVWNNLSASLGVSGNWNTRFGNHIAGGANIGYEYAPESSVYLNANRSLRLPTFTDLYYNAGNQLGNPDLKPEEAWTLSLGTQYSTRFGTGNPSKPFLTSQNISEHFRTSLNHSAREAIVRRKEPSSLSLSASAYYRWGRNIIDWVFTPDDPKRPYHAQNHNRVNAAGADLTVDYRLNNWLRDVRLSYAYTWLDLDVDKTGSRYLDYLSHKLVLHLEHGIWTFRSNSSPNVGEVPTRAEGYKKWTLGASWTLTFQKREGQFNNAEGVVTDYQPVLLLDGQVYWENPFVKIAVDCTNITNRHFYDYGGILQPGAWAKLTISAKLNTLARGLY